MSASNKLEVMLGDEQSFIFFNKRAPFSKSFMHIIYSDVSYGNEPSIIGP